MRRVLFLTALAYGLLLAGLAMMEGAVLALAIPPVIYLVASLLYRPGEPQLTATRHLSKERVTQGKPVLVRVSITNEGSKLGEVSIEETVPPLFEQVDGETSVVTPLAPGETVTLEYTVRGGRGIADFENVRVEVIGGLGLFRRELSLPAPGRLMVLPEVRNLRRLEIKPRRTRAYAGPVPARQGGSGVEFFGVREYQAGDPLRWINWRVSARHFPSLFANEFEQERIADVGLILDARRRTDIEMGDDALFEHGVRAIASLAGAFLDAGNRVGLLVYGGFLSWTFPGYGKIQRERILRGLARAQTGESLVFESLDYIPTRYFPARSQLVLVSPLCKDDLPPLIRLRARGYQLLVVSPDPVSYEMRTLPSDPAVSLAARIARLERELLLRKLQRAGIQIVDWDVEKSFDLVVHASLSRQPHWLRAIGV